MLELKNVSFQVSEESKEKGILKRCQLYAGRQ